MATIKSYTDIEQSKKLAKILPLESADMHYNNASIKGINYVDEYRAELMDYNTAQKVLSKYLINPIFGIIPCWSLASLLEQLHYEVCDDDGNLSYLQMNKEDDVYQLVYTDPNGDFESIETDRYYHFVDACVELILKLNKLNLL